MMGLIRSIFTVIYTLGLVHISNCQTIARSTISSAGNSTKMATGTYLSQTVGQGSLHSIFKSSDFTIRQGFQQVVSVESFGNPPFILSVYPNPTNGQFYIYIQTEQETLCQLTICDLFGKTIWEQELISNREQTISLPSKLAQGSYLLSVADRNKKQNSVTKLILFNP